MERLGLVQKAEQLAKQTIEDVSACGDTLFVRLSKMPEEQAIQELARDILSDALQEIS